MNKQMSKPQYYDSIPEVPPDFEGAVAIHREAVAAVRYWKERKLYAPFSSDKAQAHKMLQRWQRVQDHAEETIQSFQLRLFE